MFYKKLILTSFARLAILSLLLMAALVTTSVAQDPSGRPTETPTKGGKKGTGTTGKRNSNTRVDPGPITVTLTILTDPPESNVFINGESRGVSSAEGRFQVEKLSLGRYSVEVRKDGYNSMIRGFQAGSESPTLVFKLEPNLDEYVKEFDALITAGKLTGPDSPNALELVNTLATKFPSRPEITRLRGVLFAKLAETIPPVINNSVVSWRTISRDDMARALERAKSAVALKEDDRRVQAEAAYLAGALALRDWQTSGEEVSEANPTQAAARGLRTDVPKEDAAPPAASASLASAKAEFEKALGFEDSFTAARYQLGVVLQASGDSAGAETALVRVTQLEPRWAPAYITLGAAYHAQGKYKEAIEAYRKAIEIAPNQGAAVAGLGLSRVAKGEKDGVKDIERAMQLDPASALPNLNLAIVLSQSKSKKDLARAEEEFKKAISKNTTNLEFSNRRAERLLADLQKRKK